MIEIISISFQLSGAIILLLWCLNGAKKEQIIREYFPGSNTIKRDDDDNCILSKDRLQMITKEVYVNVMAFGNLIIGYLLTYFAVRTCTPVYAIGLTVFLVVIIIAVEELLAKLFAAMKYSKDIIVPYDLLEKYGVDTFATDKEVSDMLDEVLGDGEYGHGQH